MDLQVNYLSRGGFHLNPYHLNDQQRFIVNGYEDALGFSPSFNQQLQEHNVTNDSHQERQFQFWGPFVGGLTGLFPGAVQPGPPPFVQPGPPFTPPGPPPVTPPGQPGPPTAPPPAFTPAPQAEIGLFAVDPGAIRGCLYRYTYVWLTNRQQFWFFPIFVGRRSIAGYRWTGFSWVYFGIDLRRISSFQCF